MYRATLGRDDQTRSGTIGKILADHVVDVVPEDRGVHARCTTKHRYGRVSGHETMASMRTQLTDRGAVAINDERPSLIESRMIVHCHCEARAVKSAQP